MTKADQLATALDDFLAVSPDVEAAAVVSADGLPIASALPPYVEEDRLAAMSAALLTLGERAAAGLGKGELGQVFVEGDQGYVVLMAAGPNAVLVSVTSRDTKVGLVLYEMRRAAARVADVMEAPAVQDPAVSAMERATGAIDSSEPWSAPEQPTPVAPAIEAPVTQAPTSSAWESQSPTGFDAAIDPLQIHGSEARPDVEPSAVQPTEPSAVQETEPSAVQQTEPSAVQQTEPSAVQQTEPTTQHPTWQWTETSGSQAPGADRSWDIASPPEGAPVKEAQPLDPGWDVASVVSEETSDEPVAPGEQAPEGTAPEAAPAPPSPADVGWENEQSPGSERDSRVSGWH